MYQKLNMENVAYTEKYQKSYANNVAQLFNTTAYKDEHCCKLTDSLTHIIKNYELHFEHNGIPGTITGSLNEIINHSKDILYSYYCVDDNANFCTVIKHEDQKEYAIFRRDLYGYSVLDLSDMKDFHYIPAESFEHHGETFIWCGIHYNPLNSILAVEGCFWAAPFSVLLVEFSNPMQITVQIDINDFINKIIEKYDGIDFVSWDNNDLILEVTETNQITIKQEEYLSWFERTK